ncbi:MAG: hypothetical protein LBL45_04475 [Treponema sp.]|nr:hypothetical protein [Treponema sp.]
MEFDLWRTGAVGCCSFFRHSMMEKAAGCGFGDYSIRAIDEEGVPQKQPLAAGIAAKT